MVLTIVTILIILSVIVLAHELGHFVTARLFDIKVEEFGIGMFFRLFAFKRGETVYSINAIPMGGFVKLKGEDGDNSDDPRSFVNKKAWQKIIVLSAGVFMNFVLALLIFVLLFKFGMPQWGSEIVIKDISPNSPAQQAGIQKNDVLKQANGVTITDYSQLKQITDQNLDKKISLQLLRNKELVTAEVLVRTNPPSGEGPLGIQMFSQPIITEYQKLPLGKAIAEGFKYSVEITKEIMVGFGTMIKNLVSKGAVPSEVAGPVGVGEIVGELLKFGIVPVLQFVALFSINLAFLNFVPFPALDGGRVLFVIIESITRKKIPAKIEGMIHLAGFAVLILIMILVTYQDIVRLVK